MESVGGIHSRTLTSPLSCLPLPSYCLLWAPAVVPLSGAVVPLGLGADQFCSSGCTAASGRWYRQCSARTRAVVPARHRPSIGLASILMRYSCGGGLIGPVIPVPPGSGAVLPLMT